MFNNQELLTYIVYPFIFLAVLFAFNIKYFFSNINESNKAENSFFLTLCILFFAMIFQSIVYSFIILNQLQTSNIVLENISKNYFLTWVYTSIFLWNIIFNFVIRKMSNGYVDTTKWKVLSLGILWLVFSDIPAMIWLIYIFQITWK